MHQIYSEMKPNYSQVVSLPDVQQYVDNNLTDRYSCDDFLLVRNNRVFMAAKTDVTVPILTENLHFLYILSGEMDVMLNLEHVHLETGMMLVIGPTNIYQIERYSKDISATTLVISWQTLARIFHDGLPAYMQETPFVLLTHPDEQQRRSFSALLDVLLTHAHFTPRNELLWDALLAMPVYFLSQSANLREIGSSREQEVFIRFLRLVKQNCMEERHLAFYANRLAMTQDYLSRIVSSYSGTTAKEWIEQAVLLEAKVMLHYTNKPVSEITYDLGFPNDSFFCKYFKRLTGITPKQFRDRHK